MPNFFDTASATMIGVAIPLHLPCREGTQTAAIEANPMLEASHEFEARSRFGGTDRLRRRPVARFQRHLRLRRPPRRHAEREESVRAAARARARRVAGQCG